LLILDKVLEHRKHQVSKHESNCFLEKTKTVEGLGTI